MTGRSIFQGSHSRRDRGRISLCVNNKETLIALIISAIIPATSLMASPCGWITHHRGRATLRAIMRLTDLAKLGLTFMGVVLVVKKKIGRLEGN